MFIELFEILSYVRLIPYQGLEPLVQLLFAYLFFFVVKFVSSVDGTIEMFLLVECLYCDLCQIPNSTCNVMLDC